MGNTQSIGIAYSDQDIIGADINLVNRQFGFTENDYGTVIQSTFKTFPVTLNKIRGRITTFNNSMGANQLTAFQVLNDRVTTTSNVLISLASNFSNYIIYPDRLATGSFHIYIKNYSAVPTGTDALVIDFCIFNGA